MKLVSSVPSLSFVGPHDPTMQLFLSNLSASVTPDARPKLLSLGLSGGITAFSLKFRMSLTLLTHSHFWKAHAPCRCVSLYLIVSLSQTPCRVAENSQAINENKLF